MKTKIIILILIYFGLFGMIGSASAERFFQKNSTWYEPIPINPKLTANSSFFIEDMIEHGANDVYINGGDEWSVPIYQAAANTPLTTVAIRSSSATVKQYILDNHWDDVPIPAGALPAGNDYSCSSPGSRDGHFVILSYDKKYSWDFYGAWHCNGSWSAQTIRKWDFSGDGINYPYDGHGSQRAATVPLTHGILTHNEVVNDPEINHALIFAYNVYVSSDLQNLCVPHIYPSSKTEACLSASRPWQLREGMRLQLDPAVDCGSLGLNVYEKKVCVAMKKYGMIMVDNSGGSVIYAEAKGLHPWSWSGILRLSTWLKIPMEKMRIVQPVCSDCTLCGNCVSSTVTTPPAAPSGLQVQ